MQTHSVKFTAWEVVQRDGGGIGDEHLAYFSTNAEATKYCKQYVGHWPRRVRKVDMDKTWVICDIIGEIYEMELENKKAAALAKLTDEERKLLGLE